MPDAYVNGKRLRLNPTSAIGKGGEADIYDIGQGRALKLFKPPNHPDYMGQPAEQAAAKQRLSIHQRKLREFPVGLPERVITPLELATNQSGSTICGYTMKLLAGAEVLLRYGDRAFGGTIDPNQVVAVFRDLHRAVGGLHTAGVVIGDFNDLNVLVDGSLAYLIDADSFQFGAYPCQVFTPKFTDPLLCDPAAHALVLNQPFNSASDWYAFAVMLMNCLLFVDPYGGIYRPSDPTQRLPHTARPLLRLTIFRPEVRYPKPARHYRVLPDELLDRLQRIFERDERGGFPVPLLENLRWTTCARCHSQHARSICPDCVAGGLVKERVTIRGQVTARRVFRTDGWILEAAVQRGRLLWLYHEGGQFKRENERPVATGPLDRQARYRLAGPTSLMAKMSRLLVLEPGQPARQITVDHVGNLPVVAAGGPDYFWVNNGQLLKQGRWDQEYVGDVLAHQTLIWTGSEFGFGFYRAGGLCQGFVWDVLHRGLNDSVPLVIRGQLIDATCVFGPARCWFLYATQEGGQTRHHCLVINPAGQILATHTAIAGDGSWLGIIRGKAAAGSFLLSPTDDGVVRVETVGTDLTVTKDFPDTEPFVDAGSRLLAGPDGLYAVSVHDIVQLTIR